MSNSKIVSFFMHVALLIVLLGLISMAFNLHRFAFIGAFLILLGLLIMAVISVVGLQSNFSWSWKLLKAFFALAFIDMLLVYWLSTSKPEMFLAFLAATIAGFFIALFNTSPKKEGSVEVKKTYKPGKLIASKMGKTYHAPKCDWAKRIQRKNRIWFDSEKEAKKAGYKADDCVK